MIPNSFQKKAVSLPMTKMVGMLLMIVVLILITYKIIDTKTTIDNNLLSFEKQKLQQKYITQCEMFGGDDCLKIVKDCSEKNKEENQCSQTDIQKYKNYLRVKDCDAILTEKEKCSDDEKQAWDEYYSTYIKPESSQADTTTLKTPETGDLPKEEQITVNQAITSTITHEVSIVEFAKLNNIEENKLKTILIVESRGKPFTTDNHPTVRFECVRFNKNVQESQKVPCDTSTYKYGSAKDTGLNAFKKALEINREQAIRQSSFGIGQVMGFNYDKAGYNSPEEYYQAMFKEDEQMKAFLNFILSNKETLLTLQSDNTDWAIVAKNYNGADFKTNNYDTKLKETYEGLS